MKLSGEVAIPPARAGQRPVSFVVGDGCGAPIFALSLTGAWLLTTTRALRP